MPTYDYRCDACGHGFETFQSISARPEKKCPKCGKPKLRRLIGTGGGLIFKGSGFYITDYRSDDYKKKAKSETDAATATPAKAGAEASNAAPAETKKKDAAPAPTAKSKAEPPKKKKK